MATFGFWLFMIALATLYAFGDWIEAETEAATARIKQARKMPREFWQYHEQWRDMLRRGTLSADLEALEAFDDMCRKVGVER